MLPLTPDAFIESIRQIPVEDQEDMTSARPKAHVDSITVRARRKSAALTPTRLKSENKEMKMGEHEEPDI